MRESAHSTEKHWVERITASYDIEGLDLKTKRCRIKARQQTYTQSCKYKSQRTRMSVFEPYKEWIQVFFHSDSTMIVAASAVLQNRQTLSSQLDQKYGRRELLYWQRSAVGKFRLLPSSLTQEKGKYLCFMVTRVVEFD